ncbi:hypothetical protein ABR759_14570 [Escherichia coli]
MKIFIRIGHHIVSPGTPCGNGLTAQAAAEMGLLPGTPVAVGLIDAHAGGIGTVGVEGGALNNLAYVFRHFFMHHGIYHFSLVCTGCLGAVLQCDGSVSVVS